MLFINKITELKNKNKSKKRKYSGYSFMDMERWDYLGKYNNIKRV